MILNQPSIYLQTGYNSVIFPNVTVGEGSVVGAMSLVKKTLPAWRIYTGIPVKKLKNRDQKLINFTY